MKDNYEITWKRNDYLMALLFILLILIPIPAGVVAGASYIFGWNYYWYFWGIMMALLFAWNIWIIVKPKKLLSHN